MILLICHGFGSKSMKNSIAIITSGLKPVPAVCGGAVEELTSILLKENEKYENYQIDVYTLANPNLERFKYKNTNLIQIKNRQKIIPIRVIFSFINRVCKLFKIKKHYDYMSYIIPKYVKKYYDLIIVENSNSIFLQLKKRYIKTPMVLHLHNDFDALETDYDKTRKKIIQVEKKAVAIWTASYYLKEHIYSIIDSHKVFVLENCIDKEKYQYNPIANRMTSFYWENELKKEDFIIVYCGRFDKTKGLLELLEAISLLSDNKNIKLLLVGTNWFGTKEEREYNNLVMKAIEKLKGKVINCGYVEQNKMPQIYEIADIVIIPSQIKEAFGMVALEAISMGKPCIATACGGLLDILDEECGILIQQNEEYVKNLAKAINELYSNKKKVLDMGKKSYEKSIKFSDNKQYYKNFVKLVEYILEK